MSQKFGENPHIYKQFGHLGHNGWDISAPAGTPIYAPHDGQIKYLQDKDKNGKLQGYGYYARLTFDEDGSWEVVACHMSRFEGTNRTVRQGEIIGYVGTTGFSTGNHLHFGLRQLKNGKVLNANNGYGGSIDPTPFLKGDNMKLVKDGSTVYLTGGINVKFKIGIGDLAALGLFGDEPVEIASTSAVKESHTLSQGFILNKK